MKRCRLKRSNFKIKNKMSKENKTLDKQQNGNDFIADISHLLAFCEWYKTTNFNCEGNPPQECVDEYLKAISTDL